MKLFSYDSILIWELVIIFSFGALTNITNGLEYAVILNFWISFQADMDSNHCLSLYRFNGQVVNSCMELLIKDPCFSFAHTENSSEASFALLNKRINIWSTSPPSTRTRVFECCRYSPEGFEKSKQAGPRERETPCLQYTIHCHGDMIYIPHLLAHPVLTLDTAHNCLKKIRRYYYISADKYSMVEWVNFWLVARNFT